MPVISLKRGFEHPELLGQSTQTCGALGGLEKWLLRTDASMQNERDSEFAELRRRNGKSIEQIAAQTKISSRYLRAIEAGRFDDLPGGVYSRSYIRQYAAAIECSADPLLRLCPAEPCEFRETPQNPPVPSWLSRAWAALASPRRLL